MMDQVKIITMQKLGNKWITVSEKIEPCNQEYYYNILHDNNPFGSGTRSTYNYCKWGYMDSKAFYSPDKKTKSIYNFK